jgi:aryl-alcohol dehydrogenase-like predicted oxidoreductase
VKNIEKVERFKVIAESEGKTCGQMAVNWVIHQPGVASALVGVKNDRQVEENLKSVGWQPEVSVQDQINQIFAVEE